MPRILDVYLDSVIYLYPSKDDADRGANMGGSGFLVEHANQSDGAGSSVYVVTNLHVSNIAPVVRVNDHLSGIEVLPLEPTDWLPHPDGDDVAVAPIELSEDVHRYACVPTKVFGTEERIRQLDLGPGDESFMLGRFVTHDGELRNSPSVRFGNVSMMPAAIKDPDTGYEQDAYLVELHSLPGYSGSAVFAYRLATMTDEGEITPLVKSGPVLLGLDWCHLTREVVVTQSDGKTRVTGLRVQAPTGMSAVIPAWKILETLESVPSTLRDSNQRDSKRHERGRGEEEGESRKAYDRSSGRQGSNR